MHHDAFAGFRTFLQAARVATEESDAVEADAVGGRPARLRAVKWQFVGPVTLGLALVRAGVSRSIAFDVANHAVSGHVRNLVGVVERSLPGRRQVVFLDEPSIGELMDADFPIAPDRAIDLVSACLAEIERSAVSGLHCCGSADFASLIATGPSVLSIPVSPSLVDVAGYLTQFQEHGGIVAWGAVATSGPIPTSAERPWRRLSELWCDLVERGCDPGRLRRQSMITPECGLGMHTPAVAERVYRITTEVARRVHDQAVAARFVLGA
jgi:methionine synthase II (cobalamin-independent)